MRKLRTFTTGNEEDIDIDSGRTNFQHPVSFRCRENSIVKRDK